MPKSAALEEARAISRLVRDVVAAAPIACSPEDLIYAETCASMLNSTITEALRATRPDDEVAAHLRVAEAVAIDLGIHALDMHQSGIVGGVLFDALTAVVCRLRAELQGLRRQTKERLLRVA
jgi:hypothetical protein